MKKILMILVTALQLPAVTLHPADPSAYRPAYAYSGEIAMRRGAYVTALAWQRSSLAFARDFDLVEGGSFSEIADAVDRGELDPARQRIVAYEWLAGFYKQERDVKKDPFLRWVWKHREETLLNASLDLHPMGKGDYYYDLCNATLRRKRVDDLVAKVARAGIAGLFFDWAGGGYLTEDPRFQPMYDRFREKHPGKTIGDFIGCVGAFYRELRSRGVLLVTNQAYRHPKLLNHVDYDMTESYLLTVAATGKRRRIDGKVRRLRTSDYVRQRDFFDWAKRLKRLKRRYSTEGFRNFIYMNYAAPALVATQKGMRSAPPVEAIYYAAAMSYLEGFIPYTEVPFSRKLERDPVYFADLGSPLARKRREEGMWLREFERGVVLVSSGASRERYLALEGIECGALFDLRERLWLPVHEGTSIVRIRNGYDPVSGRIRPTGKILLCPDE